MLNELNEKTKQFIIDTELENMDDFMFINKLMNIYNKHIKNYNIRKYDTKVSLHKSLNYSYEFLKSINPIYADYLMDKYNEGTFIFDENKDKLSNLSYSSIENGKNIIYMPVQNNIDDAYTFTHEIIHDMSVVKVEDKSTRTIFCEMFSLLAEELQRDYFDLNNGPKEYKKNSLINLKIIKEKNILINIEEQLISKYLEKKYIDKIDLLDIISNSDDMYYSSRCIEYISANDYSIHMEQRYVIGYLFACYMLDRINNDSKKIKEFFELNEMINDYYIEDFLDYLDINLLDTKYFDLDDKSYEKIENSYVKRLKKY